MGLFHEGSAGTTRLYGDTVTVTQWQWFSIIGFYWPGEIGDFLISPAHIIYCILQDWFNYQDYAPKLMGDGELGGDSIVARSLEAKKLNI